VSRKQTVFIVFAQGENDEEPFFKGAFLKRKDATKLRDIYDNASDWEGFMLSAPVLEGPPPRKLPKKATFHRTLKAFKEGDKFFTAIGFVEGHAPEVVTDVRSYDCGTVEINGLSPSDIAKVGGKFVRIPGGSA
jgi:hypothetical protein